MTTENTTDMKRQLDEFVEHAKTCLPAWKGENGYVVGDNLICKLEKILRAASTKNETQSCQHNYVLDEEHLTHSCCQKCGHVVSMNLDQPVYTQRDIISGAEDFIARHSHAWNGVGIHPNCVVSGLRKMIEQNQAFNENTHDR